MSEFMFGASRMKPNGVQRKILKAAAKRHGAWLVEANIPGTGYQRWFAAPNLGFPFDRDRAKAVLAECNLIAGR